MEAERRGAEQDGRDDEEKVKTAQVSLEERGGG